MILYEKRAPRWVHFVCLVLTVGLTMIMAYALLQEPSTHPFERSEEMGPGFKMALGFFILIGTFLTGVFAYRLFRNPAYFVITEEGFEYSPGGVSTGLIRWADIVELREEKVITNRNGIGGPAFEVALAVVLRNPEEYVARYPKALKPLFAVRQALNSSPLLMRPSDFGADYRPILTIMREQVARHAGKKA